MMPTIAARSCTGLFKFVEWKSGEYIRVEKNTDYWRGDEYPMGRRDRFQLHP